MKVRDLMIKEVLTLSPEITYASAVFFLRENKISGAPVVDSSGELIGFVSEKDLFRAIFPTTAGYHRHPEIYSDLESREEKVNELKGNAVSHYMIKNVTAVSPDTPILKAGAIMLANGFHRLPVIENNLIVGMIEREHIYRAILGRIVKPDEPNSV